MSCNHQLWDYLHNPAFKAFITIKSPFIPIFSHLESSPYRTPALSYPGPFQVHLIAPLNREHHGDSGAPTSASSIPKQSLCFLAVSCQTHIIASCTSLANHVVSKDKERKCAIRGPDEGSLNSTLTNRILFNPWELPNAPVCGMTTMWNPGWGVEYCEGRLKSRLDFSWSTWGEWLWNVIRMAGILVRVL